VTVRLVVVALVVEAFAAKKEPGNITWLGSERVTAPVEADALIWFAVPAMEVTPVLVMVRPLPMMYCPAVTEMPEPADTVPVAAA
jgi:hypothetical protein